MATRLEKAHYDRAITTTKRKKDFLSLLSEEIKLQWKQYYSPSKNKFYRNNHLNKAFTF